MAEAALFDAARFDTLVDIGGGVLQPVRCQVYCSHPMFCRHLIWWRLPCPDPLLGDERPPERREDS